MLITVLLVVIIVIFGTQALKRRRIAQQSAVSPTPAAGATASPRAGLAVYVNGSLYTVSPLIAGEAVTVSQPSGATNVIRMTENGFYMEESTCEGHDCILQGAVTYQNWVERILGASVICLPNRVEAVLLVEKTDIDAPDV